MSAGPATDTALDAITAALEQRRTAERDLVESVRRARRAGHSWAEIARQLGTTRQAAWERFAAARAGMHPPGGEA